jgi:glycosidase
MQWDDSANAGFTKAAKPWLPVPPSAKTHNVASELSDPNSILQFYRQLLLLHHRNHALLDGDYVSLNQDDPNVLSYLRRYKNEAVLVVLNMSGTAQQVRFNLSAQGFSSTKAKTLLTTSAPAPSGQLDQIALEPFAVYIAQVSR